MTCFFMKSYFWVDYALFEGGDISSDLVRSDRGGGANDV